MYCVASAYSVRSSQADNGAFYSNCRTLVVDRKHSMLNRKSNDVPSAEWQIDLRRCKSKSEGETGVTYLLGEAVHRAASSASMVLSVLRSAALVDARNPSSRLGRVSLGPAVPGTNATREPTAVRICVHRARGMPRGLSPRPVRTCARRSRGCLSAIRERGRGVRGCGQGAVRRHVAGSCNDGG